MDSSGTDNKNLFLEDFLLGGKLGFNNIQKEESLTYKQVLKQVSEEMGHHRADITEHYV